MKIFFNSSLPRSGSTLLQNILGQNENFYVTPTSGVLELLYAARNNFSNSLEFKAQDKKTVEKGFISFCKEGLEGYYKNITNKKYIVDKSRGWGVHYNFLNTFYPNPKIICMIRDIRDIFTSFEVKFRENQLYDNGIINHSNMTGTTTEKRIDVWAQSQPIGLALERLYQIILEKNDDKILFVKYEKLIKEPKNQLNRVYDFLEVEKYTHDFNNIKQITKEDDEVYGIFGNHDIKNKITNNSSKCYDILGNHACNWIKNNYQWFYDKFEYY